MKEAVQFVILKAPKFNEEHFGGFGWWEKLVGPGKDRKNK
jgi:homoserine acetyltransferase